MLHYTVIYERVEALVNKIHMEKSYKNVNTEILGDIMLLSQSYGKHINEANS